MGLIESSKVYSGQELENIFFRPAFTGESAEKLGIRVLYNMPVPTTVYMWNSGGNILKPYKAGWDGDTSTTRSSKALDMKKIKAETAFSAADYFSMVFEQLANNPAIDMQDLSGSVLEEAETELFKASIAESLRLTTWVGDTDKPGSYDTFDGILKSAVAAAKGSAANQYKITAAVTSSNVISVFENVWKAANNELKALKGDGQLAFFVTSDICEAYEAYLDSKGVDSAYRESTEGRQNLCYHGIPVIDMGIGSVLADTSLPQTICLLTDRRNLVLAVNTADYPATEVRMWYNPDAMENRQRAVFLAAADIIDNNLTVLGYKEA